MRLFGSVGCLLLAGVLASGADTPAAQVSGRAPKVPGGPARDAGISGVSAAYAYRTHCASCHGTDGKGEGPLAESLRFQPPDLTLLARRNGGDYPAERIQRIVDGRKPLPGHGGPDMPVWGDAFRNAETGFDDAAARQKIRSVVDFVRTLQVHAR